MNLALMRSARAVLALVTGLAVLSIGPSGVAAPGGPKCRVASPSGTPATPANDGLRVATLNSLHGLDDDVPADYPSHGTLAQRLQMQAEQLAADGVDVVGMQEVSVFQVGASDPTVWVAEELAGALATETGERWWSCWFLANPHFPGEPDVQEGGGGPLSEIEARLVSQFAGGPYSVFKEGVAVLSRYQITESDGLHLPGRLPVEIPLCLAESFPSDPESGAFCAATAGFETRAALWARIATPDGTVDVTSTHLAHHITSASNASSLEQAVAAVAFAEAHAAIGDPDKVFFMCDCNSEPVDDYPVVKTIEDAGWTNTFTVPCDAPGDAGCTAGPDKIVMHGTAARAMFERLDYVFAREGTCTSSASLVVNTPVAYTDAHGAGWLYPSDHIGVAADVCV